MSIVHDLLKDVSVPKVVKVRQHFPAPVLEDVEAALRQELGRSEIAGRALPGMRIALAVGSRGMDRVAALARVTVEELKKLGAIPFVVPAMGSHGGATAAGQRNVLANLGVTEETVGCPILSSMETVEVGRLENGLPVLMDKHAYEADGIVVLNRVKPHNAFRGPSESGLVKMLAIGLGKQKGADSCHTYGFGRMAEFIVKMAAIKLAACPVLFGIATVENAYDKIMKVAAVPADGLIAADQELQAEAKANMPRIMFDQFDVLVIDWIGKEFSGGGIDGNITGRNPTPYISGGPSVSKIAVLDVTEKSAGNANGVGLADVTTRRLFAKYDFDAVYANALTSTVTASARIPMLVDTDREAVCAALKTCYVPDTSKARLVRIKNTLDLREIYVSEALLPEAAANPSLEVAGTLGAMAFAGDGTLADPW